MSHVLPVGIDLGTSTSVLSVFRDGRPEAWPSPLSSDGSAIVPSVVAWSASRGEVVVGGAALRDNPSVIREFKRLMGTDARLTLGDQSYSPQELSAFLLRGMCRKASESLGFPIEEAVISVPANFKDAARQATLDAAAIAGLKVPRLIPEPTAAALAFGIQNIEADERILVFDFGGGTLDITLLQMCAGVMDVERVDGDERLGGKDMDAAILQGVLQKIQQRYPGAEPLPQYVDAARRACQQAKQYLSRVDSTPLVLPEFARWRGETIPLDIDLRREDMEAWIAPLLDRAQARLRRLLQADGRVVDPASVSRVLMVGGSTYIPAVRQRVAEAMGRAVSTEVDPERAVSLGTAVQAALSAGVLKGDGALILADVSPFSVGVEVVQPMGSGGFMPGVFSPLIARNQPIPHRSSHRFALMHPMQKECLVNIYQGNSKFVAENERLASARLSDIPPSLGPSPHSLIIDFSYDLSGIAGLHIRIAGTAIEARLEVDPRQGRMDVQAQEQAAARLAAQEEVDPRLAAVLADVQPLLARARRVLARNGEDAALAGAITHLEVCIHKKVVPTIQSAQDRLVDALLAAEGN